MKLLLLSPILLILLSCKGQQVTSDNSDDNKRELTLLVQDGYYPTEGLETLVIKDSKSLNAFFSKVNRTRKPGIPVPEVNFSKEMVLVACMGAQKGKELPIMINKQTKEKGLLVTIVSNSSEKGDDMGTSYPFCMYKTPLSDEDVTFEVQ